MQISYKGMKLKKTKGKSGGKNNSKVDGFYQSMDVAGKPRNYFVKKPDDRVEFFCELFAGRLIAKFAQKGLIDEDIADLLVCADTVRLKDGSYALIQPNIEHFKELYKTINTAYRDGSDRSPFYEMVFGSKSYTEYLSSSRRVGLSSLLFYSLLLGDYSVHSGNIFVKEADGVRGFGRIDWGASFRHYAHAKNDVLYPAEYTGFSSYKRLTKNYISYHKYIPDILPAIGRRALQFQHQMQVSEIDLESLIFEVVSELPVGLFDAKQREQIAAYLNIASVKDALDGNERANHIFAKALANYMSQRLTKIQLFNKGAKPIRFKLTSFPHDKDFMPSLNLLSKKLTYLLNFSWDKEEDLSQAQCQLIFTRKCIKRLKQKQALLKASVKEDENQKSYNELFEKSDALLLQLSSHKKPMTASDLQELVISIDDCIATYHSAYFNVLTENEQLNARQTDVLIKTYFSIPKAMRTIDIAALLDLINEKKGAESGCYKALSVIVASKIQNDELIKELIDAKHIPQQLAKYYPKTLDESVITDLQVLSQFKRKQALSNKGDDYHRSINKFFKDAIGIRLSSDLTHELQFQAIRNAAHERFKHRHFIGRLLLDTLLMISVLCCGAGLLIRYATKSPGTPFFALAKPTTRQEQVEHELLDDENDKQHLFKSLTNS
jgi:LepB N-terminal domain